MKQCTKCKKIKDEAEFYQDRRRKDGRVSECKECSRARMREKYHADPAVRERKRIWAKTKRDKKKHAEYNKEYTKTERGREVQKRGRDKYRREHPERIRAKNFVHWKVRQGQIPPISSQVCEMCGQQAENYHHSDYSKPLDIMPLCRKCHLALHKEMNQ